MFNAEKCGKKMRNYVYDQLRLQNIFSRKYLYPITEDAACFKNKYKKVPLENARYAGDNILVLPLYPELEYEALNEIVKSIKKFIKN